MNKQEIIDIMSSTADISKGAAESALNAFMDAVTGALKGGDEVALTGFGSFKTAVRAAREGRNPQTGDVINIPSAVVARFKAGKKLKDAVNEATTEQES